MREIYTVYVLCVDGYITAVASSVLPMDSSKWTEIDSGYGDKYYLAQNNYFPKPISTKNGAYRYRLVNGDPVECTPEEIAAQEEANEPVNPPTGDLEQRVANVESDVADLTAAIEKGLML